MLHIIVNPTSNSGNGAKILKKAEKTLQQEGVSCKLHKTSPDISATEIAKQITCDEAEHTIAVIGGDGTLNEVINGIRDYSKVTLGFIPSGTGGDFARDLGLSNNPVAALDSILHPSEFKMMDIGHLENKELSKNFAVSCGIGFDASVALATSRSTLKNYLSKIKLASLSYVLIAIQKILRAKKNGCTMILDDTKEIHYDNFFFVSPMIHRFEGGGFMFCPDAECDDGLLDICVAGDIRKFRVFYIIPAAYMGRHTRFKGIDLYRAKKIRIISDKPLEIHTDGEYAGFQDEMTVSLCSKKIRVIVS